MFSKCTSILPYCHTPSHGSRLTRLRHRRRARVASASYAVPAGHDRVACTTASRAAKLPPHAPRALHRTRTSAMSHPSYLFSSHISCIATHRIKRNITNHQRESHSSGLTITHLSSARSNREFPVGRGRRSRSTLPQLHGVDHTAFDAVRLARDSGAHGDVGGIFRLGRHVAVAAARAREA